ncbi:hypothetical protein HPB50_021133 [Hyalomma asiaticum]|uniref:Uncharacterized protein n=1 Tax=Hyalomma asiaticum TaxID=266040 RepID=A0ACB7TN55_HYAAI|nr:hypothetical protein HPB50_021133 [Hyalomma asiaticum]
MVTRATQLLYQCIRARRIKKRGASGASLTRRRLRDETAPERLASGGRESGPSFRGPLQTPRWPCVSKAPPPLRRTGTPTAGNRDWKPVSKEDPSAWSQRLPVVVGARGLRDGPAESSALQLSGDDSRAVAKARLDR